MRVFVMPTRSSVNIKKRKKEENILNVTECNRLFNISSSISDFSIADHAVNDLYKRPIVIG